MSNAQRLYAENTFSHFLLKKYYQKTLWEDVDQCLQPWLDERHILIRKWHKALTKAQNYKHTEREVKELCQVLMDYISAGHFEIYEKLMEESKAFNDGFLSLAEPLYELIGHNTEQALRFNERYTNPKSCQLRKRRLPFDLSCLGESLEERFEAEDQLVKFLHLQHQTS